MAINEVYKIGANLSGPVETGVRSGTPVRIGVINAVATTDEGSLAVPGSFNADGSYNISNSNEPGYASLALWGVWKLPITGTTTAGYGAPVYITSTNTLSLDSVDGELFGALWGTKGATDGQRVPVLLKN